MTRLRLKLEPTGKEVESQPRAKSQTWPPATGPEFNKNKLDAWDRGEDDILGEKLGLRKTEEGGGRHPSFDFQKSRQQGLHCIVVRFRGQAHTDTSKPG